MTKPKGKILVIRGGAIGDFILTLPALAALRAQFHNTQIEVLGYAHIASLAKAGGLVDDVRHIESRALAGFFARNADHDPTLIEYFGGFNIIISYLYDPDLVFQTCVGAASSEAQFIAGPHRPEEAADVHATDVFLQPLERLAIYGADPIPRLTIQSSNGHANLGGTLALHPGSGSERKNWPVSHWSKLIEQLLAETPHQLLLVGGEAEGERMERLGALIPAQRGKVLKNAPLVDLARALQHCLGFIGHDSGVTHLAAALGLKTLVLWGETREAVWKPRSERAHILRNPRGLSGIDPAEVFTQARAHLALTGRA